MSRIIAGSARGQRIIAPKGDATRPTTDRVRESLFATLASWFATADVAPADQLRGIAVLDLYAGSGALGLEAASRGAARVTCVEADAAAARIIRDNARRTQLPVTIAHRKALAAVESVTPPVDLVVADPPYNHPTQQVNELLAALVAAEALLPSGLVVVERSTRSEPITWPAALADRWQRRYGETTLHFAALREAS
ncbi:MAG: 16S rRNA (guanine(966)-N(2))-methyltransferase RsmD [Arachnia sp.]